MASKKVLMFAPYGQWTVHHQVDAVWGAALQSRGCDVVAILCDGLFQSCPIAGKPPDQNTCRTCSQMGKQLFAALGVPTVQLRSFLTEKDFKECRKWADDISPDDMILGNFEGLELGEWIRSTLHGYFLVGTLDYTNPEIAPVARDFLYNCALIKRGLLRAIAELRGDSMVCFHAMQVYYRAAFELSRSVGLPVLVHERGFTDDSFSIFKNCISIRNQDVLRIWELWKDVPLELEEMEQVKSYFQDREQGKNTNFSPFYDFQTDASRVRQALRIPAGGKILAMFTSGDWEVGISASHFQMAFDSQLEWMRATAKICERNNIYLVIRHHPILVKGGRIVKRFLKELFRLNLEFPNHVRVVMPYEKITSYAIIWNADVVTSFLSTTGPESIIRGIPTLCMGDSFWRPIGMDWVKSAEHYEQAILNNVAKNGSIDWQNYRKAYRYAHLFFYRMVFKFKSFGFKEVYSPDLRIKSISELAPGLDPALDRICDSILYDSELHLLPTSGRQQAEARDEEIFLKRELEACNTRRKTLRETSSKFAPDPPIAFLRIISQTSTGDSDSILLNSLKRSRCQTIRRVDLDLALDISVNAFVESMVTQLQSLPEKFVAFGTNDLQVDESVLSTALNILFHGTEKELEGVQYGAWICDAEGLIQGEIFTETAPAAEYVAAKLGFEKVKRPITLLSLIVMKTESLLSFFKKLKEYPPESLDKLAETCFVQFFGKKPLSRMHSISLPMQIFYLPPDADATDDRDLAVLFRLSGDTEKAKMHYEQAIKKFPSDKELQAEYFSMLSDNNDAPALQNVKTGLNEPAPILPVSNLVGVGKVSVLTNPRVYTNYEDVHAMVETVEGWMLDGQPKFLFNKVKSLSDGAIILELGANHGKSTCAMAFACVGTNKRIISIDAFCDSEDPETGAQGADFLHIWKGNLTRLGLESYATPMRGYTHDLLENWNPDLKLDFVFIDASHEYIDVLLDFQLVYPKVKQNGWIAFHDVEPGWPGSWRVWIEAAAPLLSEHEVVSTLSAGRKIQIHLARNNDFRGYKFSYSRQWIKALREQFPQIEELYVAMETSLECYSGKDSTHEKFPQAETVIMRMPHVLRKVLRNMLSKDAKLDGHLHYWNALCLLSEGQLEEALSEFREATKVSFAVPRIRVERFCEFIAKELEQKYNSTNLTKIPGIDSPGKVDVNVLGYKDKEYISYRKSANSFSGAADVFKFSPYLKANFCVVQLGSGGGFLLRNIYCMEKVGIENNKFARKEASNVRGIESVEKIEDLPNAWADLIISDQYLSQSKSPLNDLMALRSKLKPNGTIVFVVPHQGPGESFKKQSAVQNLYTWNPMTLGNLFQQAGYEVVSVEAFQHKWPPEPEILWESLGEQGFHKACQEYAVKEGAYQIRIEARNNSV